VNEAKETKNTHENDSGCPCSESIAFEICVLDIHGLNIDRATCYTI